MKINEIIRERRLAKGFTQEQIANYLGVSAPAVNKWEKGTSYPDIILLPALARLLDTDLNTLLSFQDDLSEKEVALFMNEVSETMDKNGFEAGYLLATEKLKEYPTCDLLVSNLAMLLDGALMLHGSKNKSNEMYREKIESLYYRAAQSEDATIREQAQACLISKLMGKQDYEQAQEILNTLPKKSPVDREQAQANIYIAQGDLEKAAKLIEEKLLSATNEIHAALMTLMEIALKEERMEAAKYIADVDKQAAQLFDLWEYNSYVAHFQLSKVGQQLGTDNMVFRCPCVFFDAGLHICRVLLHEARKRHIQIGGGFIELFTLPSQCFPLCLEAASLRLLALSCPVRIAVDHTPCVRFFFLIDCHYESFLSSPL